MDISKIDKNFASGAVDGDGIKRYIIPDGRFDLYGVFHDGARFLRLPQDIAEKTSGGVEYLNTNTAGGRVRFSTDSEKIEISATYDYLTIMPHMAISGSGGFVLIDETDGNPKFAGAYFPTPDCKKGFSICKAVNPAKTMRSYVLYMPLYNDVKTLAIGVDGDATVGDGKKYRDVKPVLYYGSSITQGGCASRPDTSYEAVIALWSNVDFINLGFSGNGKAEQIMADYLSGLDCSVFVCDYDYNAPDAEHLRKTHYNLYETFRKKQKDTPVIFISRPNPEYDTFFDKPENDERYKIIENTFLTARASGDKNVYLINGYELYGENDRMLCAVDSCHPTDRGFYLMAKRIWETLKNLI